MSKLKSVDTKNFKSDAVPREDFFPEPGVDFVITPYIQDLTNRALAYLRVGYAVHLSGPAGTGKSTLAMHIASQLGQPCTLLHGDDEFKASDLLGRDTGYQKSSTIDNYISSIVKTEESVSLVWTSNRLTTACQKGHTLIYDEFTRSPATANNPFLSILEEGILNIPSSGREKGYIRVDPKFRAIFTSNPEEYVGVHKTQDALLDRMITIELEYPDQETEVAIVCAKSERSLEDAEHIVRIVRAVRKQLGGKNGPTVRSAIAIARILNHRACNVDANDPVFVTTCKDVLTFHVSRQSDQGLGKSKLETIISRLGRDHDQLTSPAVSSILLSESRAPEAIESHEEQLLVSTLDLSRTVTQGLTAQESVPAKNDSKNLSESGSDSLPRVYDSGDRPDHGLPPLPVIRPATTAAAPRLAAEPSSEAASLVTAPADPYHRSIPTLQGSSEQNSLETASPQQMLAAAVNRFVRPPQIKDSPGGIPGAIYSGS